jgi:hypothetical protein
MSVNPNPNENPSNHHTLIYSTKNKSRLVTQQKNSNLKIISKTISKYLKFNTKTCLPVISTYPIHTNTNTNTNIHQPKLKEPFLIISLNNNPFIQKYYQTSLESPVQLIQEDSLKEEILSDSKLWSNYLTFIINNLREFETCEFIGYVINDSFMILTLFNRVDPLIPVCISLILHLKSIKVIDYKGTLLSNCYRTNDYIKRFGNIDFRRS